MGNVGGMRLMVKKILDHDGRANPFPDDLAMHSHHAGHPY